MTVVRKNGHVGGVKGCGEVSQLELQVIIRVCQLM